MTDLMELLASKLGEKIARKYRISATLATELVVELWSKRPPLLALFASASNEKSITRTRVYKDAERDATRKVYYQLRRYQGAQSVESWVQSLKDSQQQESARQSLVQNHVSTAERLNHLEAVWSALDPFVLGAKTLLDVGSGILPLVFPFQRFALERYFALDRSEDSVDTINAYATGFERDGLTARRWEIAQGWDEVTQGQWFDLAFMFKLVPVVERHEVDSLDILAQVPANKVLVTGCKTAMVKQQDIRRRERGSLERFAETYGFCIKAEFETPDEVGLVLEKARGT